MKLFTGEVTVFVGRQVALETGEAMEAQILQRSVEMSGRLGRLGRYLEHFFLLTGGIKSGSNGELADCPKLDGERPCTLWEARAG